MSPTEQAGGRFRLVREGLLLPGAARISFQRCRCPADGRHSSAPRSLGLLVPGASKRRDVLLPVDAGEGFWLGFESRGADRVWIAVSTADGRRLNPCSGRGWRDDPESALRLKEQQFLDGIRDPQGGVTWAFCRVPPVPECPGTAALGVSVTAPRPGGFPGDVIVTVVDYDTFRRETGRAAPPPLDLDAGYQGWRLP